MGALVGRVEVARTSDGLVVDSRCRQEEDLGRRVEQEEAEGLQVDLAGLVGQERAVEGQGLGYENCIGMKKGGLLDCW